MTRAAPLKFALVLSALFAALVLQAPIEQVPRYNEFADSRALLGVPSFWNMVSNLPLLVAGVLGLHLVLARPAAPARLEWLVCFAGATLAAFGSAYYHAAPSDATLVWDRLPIGIAFAGFFSALVAENVGARAGRRLLLPALAFAAGSVLWWRWSGDLSLWIFAQAGPMLAIVLVFALFPSAGRERRWLGWALACYAVAKLFELGDGELMRWTAGAMSGHPLKHLLAAAGVFCFYGMLRRRAPRPA